MSLAPAALAATVIIASAGGATVSPHYRSCGQADSHRVRIYASEVSCSTALTVERKCWVTNCFGQLPLATATDFDLPILPTSKPLGFACWQAYGRYARGLPPPPRDRKVFLILCERHAANGRRQLVAYTQLG
jgi:hypothetical protein